MGVCGAQQVGCRLIALLQGTRGSSKGQGLAALKAHREGQGGRRKMADSQALSSWVWKPPCHRCPLPHRIQLLEMQLPPLRWPSSGLAPGAGRAAGTRSLPSRPFCRGCQPRPHGCGSGTQHRLWGDGASPAGCSLAEVLGGDGFSSSRGGLHHLRV